VSEGRFERIAVVGLGLLGGSVALAARERGLARSVVAAGRRPAPLEAARRRGVVDAVLPLGEVARGADLLLLATPVGVMAQALRGAAPALATGALVTDVGSVKGRLAETLPGLLPAGVAYVGSHPMAGSHLHGVEHARADLFAGAACVLTPTPESDSAAVAKLRAFWSGLGARVVLRDPARHDAEVAWVSHVPHVLAFAFARALEAAPAAAAALRGAGFRDFTRIARSDAEIWSEILAHNAKALGAPLERVAARLSELARAVEAGDRDGIERFLAQAREDMQSFEAPSGGENPEIHTQGDDNTTHDRGDQDER
jgi:prephenate dehydrogenase